ncbi:hypothetical protein FQR65_LT02130 [Abscondita terminalis]|nr:hypothetical protein FQR65_LT02130 [Abscondita terminalis]
MTDLRQCLREFLTAFIELYETFLCFWRVKSKDYSDRDQKGEAYGILVEKYKEIDPAANRETIVKKWNSLRKWNQKDDRGQRTEDRGQKTKDKEQKTEDRGQRAEAEGKGQRTENREQKTENKGQKTVDRGQKTDGGGQKTEDRGQRT